MCFIRWDDAFCVHYLVGLRLSNTYTVVVVWLFVIHFVSPLHSTHRDRPFLVRLIFFAYIDTSRDVVEW